MTSEAAARAVAEARALMRAKRDELCRHGVATCRECARAALTPPTEGAST